MGNGTLPGCRVQLNSEYYYDYAGSKTVGDKLHRREGISPDRQLRSLNVG